MPDYKMNTPIRAFKETLWYRMLRVLYEANKPLHKKDWFRLSKVHFSDKPLVLFRSDGFESRSSSWPYRHWKGLYPAMFKKFQRLGLVSYIHKEKKWCMNRTNYKLFCLSLNVEP